MWGMQKGFSTKIGLGHHKRLMHPLVRNLERIASSHPKESSVRAAHKKVWTEEEEALLSQLKYAGNRNINKLIVEHIPPKMAKKINDKRHLLMKGPPMWFNLKSKVTLMLREKSSTRSLNCRERAQLKLHYCDVTRKGLLACRFAKCQSAFEKILDGQDPQGVVNDAFENCFGGLSKALLDYKGDQGSKVAKVPWSASIQNDS